MDWALDEARAARRERALPHRLHRQPPRAALLRPLWLRGGRPLRLHGRQPCRRRHHHAEDAVSDVEVIRAISLGGLPHGFLGRRGGMSVGDCAGLNVGFGSNDDREAIAGNRRLAVAALAAGAELVDRPPGPFGRSRRRRRTPGRRTSARAPTRWSPTGPNLLLGILTADCAPVLFADHRGGRRRRRPCRLARRARRRHRRDDRGDGGARRPPRAHPRRGRPVHRASRPTRSTRPSAPASSTPIPTTRASSSTGPAGKPHFDLEAYVVHRLIAAGIGEVEALNLDTYADADRFFSYRRATHRGEADYGRQLSAIAIPG